MGVGQRLSHAMGRSSHAGALDAVRWLGPSCGREALPWLALRLWAAPSAHELLESRIHMTYSEPHGMRIAVTAPSMMYYRAVEGRWSGPLVFSAARNAAFVRARAPWIDRARARVLALLARLGLRLLMQTSVDASSRIARNEVVHTTRLSKWGLTLYESTELLTLELNGRDVLITRRERVAPSRRFSEQDGHCRAEVEASSLCARYFIPFFGGVLRQTARIEFGCVRLVQEADVMRGTALLVRD